MGDFKSNEQRDGPSEWAAGVCARTWMGYKNGPGKKKKRRDIMQRQVAFWGNVDEF